MTHQKLNKHLIKIITDYIRDIDLNVDIDIDIFDNDIINLIKNEEITESFYIKNEEHFKPYIEFFIHRTNFPLEFIKRNINWRQHLYQIVCNPNTPYLFYDDYLDKLNEFHWKILLEINKVIPFWWYEKHIETILKFLTVAKLYYLFKNSEITETFIENYMIKNNINYWHDIINNSKLSYSFYLKHKLLIPDNLWNSKIKIKECKIKSINNLLLSIL